MKLLCLAGLILPALAFAQTNPIPASGTSGNLVANGGFAIFTQKDNYWDGVDANGFLCGERGTSAAVLEAGNFGSLDMPLSVQVADLNGDGLLDIFTVDPKGYFRVYFNSGTPTEPKFTTCEMVPLFISRWGQWTNWRWGLKAALGDFEKKGIMDLVIGDFAGEIFWLQNSGSKSTPEFKQPGSLGSIMIRTTNDGHLWANLLAPCLYDWNKDGKLDLIVGEGSYSANAVHLLINQGNGSSLKFTEDARYFLAFGDGREQLVPTVVDYNGDGNPDLLVGDRKGTISLYLSEGPWKPKAELKFKSVVSFGSVSTFNGCVAPTVADLNGDGLFDLIIGKSDGHIAVAYNKGTKTVPKFDTPVDLKGTEVYRPDRSPTGWVIDNGYGRGNLFNYYTVVSAEEEKDGTPAGSPYALKFGYVPSLNKIIKMPPFMLSGSGGTLNEFRGAEVAWEQVNYHWRPWTGSDEPGYFLDSNVVIVRKIFDPFPFKANTSYQLRFKTKGKSTKNCHWTFSLGGWGKRVEDKVIRSERNAAQIARDSIAEEVKEEGDFVASASWSPVAKQMRFKFKGKEMNDPEHWKGVGKPEYRAILEIRATLAPQDGMCYIGDVELVPSAGQ